MSALAELSRERFQPVVPTPDPAAGESCRARGRPRAGAEGGDARTAVFLDQLYPFPEAEPRRAPRPPGGAEVVWVQEAVTWALLPSRASSIAHGRIAPSSGHLGEPRPAPQAHALEQRTLLNLAFSPG
jgi:hypothetical protein